MGDGVRSVDHEGSAIVSPIGTKIQMKWESDGQAALMCCHIEDRDGTIVAVFLIRYAETGS